MIEKRYIFDEYRNVEGPQDLPQDDVAGIERCIRTGFAGGIRDDDAQGHMSGDQVIVIRDRLCTSPNRDDSVVGFSSTLVSSPHKLFGYEDVSKEDAGYFAGAALDDAYQGRGLYNELFTRRYDFVREHGIETLFTRTQNPAVLKGMARGIERLIVSGDVRAYRFGQRICRNAYYGRLKTNMTTEFPYIDTDGGDALIFTWDLVY